MNENIIIQNTNNPNSIPNICKIWISKCPVYIMTGIVCANIKGRMKVKNKDKALGKIFSGYLLYSLNTSIWCITDLTSPNQNDNIEIHPNMSSIITIPISDRMLLTWL